MRAVVTGGAGFLGSHVCERLLDQGHDVVCVDNLATGVIDNLGPAQQNGGRARLQVIRHDVSDPLDIDGPVDVVLHLACPASPPDYLRLAVETMRAGSLGTMHALDLALHHGARFVLASTSEVYGDPHVHPQPESYWGNVNPVGPRAVYDEAKRFSEAVTMAYRRTYDLDTGIVRIFNSYGPRMRRGDGRAVPTFIERALAGEPLPVAGDGLQTRSLCYVDDTVEGILAMAASDLPGPVNIGSSDEVTVLELAQRILELTSSTAEIRFVERPEDDPTTRRPDTTTAREQLGWQPRVPLDEGLRRTISWFAAGGRQAGTPDGRRHGGRRDGHPVGDVAAGTTVPAAASTSPTVIRSRAGSG